MSDKINIHDTAFVTCQFRAENPEISKDEYAALWTNDRVKQWRDQYITQVSSEESIAHAMRNRFYLDTLKELIKNHEIETVINFGSGFSMYPYLLDERIQHIEIDKPSIVEYKEITSRKWMDEEKLPYRDIIYLSVDFDEDYIDELYEHLSRLTENKTTFILIEGVLFFLNLRQTADLFSLFNNVQKKRGYIGSASYEPSITETTAFKMLMQFMDGNVNPDEPHNYLYLPTRFYEDLPNYNLIDHQDFYSLANKYGYIHKCDKDLILNEHFYILSKQK